MITRPSAVIDFLDRTEVFDGDMRPRDFIEALERLHFRNGLLTIRLDKEARDFLLAALIARYGK